MIRIRRTQKQQPATYIVQGVTRAGRVGVAVYSTTTQQLLGWGVSESAAIASMQVSASSAA